MPDSVVTPGARVECRRASQIRTLQVAPSIPHGENRYWLIENQTTKHNYDAQNPGIRLLTTQSALGLEFKSVYLLWARDFFRALEDAYSEWQLVTLRELYVVITLAQDQLPILCSASSAIGRPLEEFAESLGLEVVHA